MNQTFPQHEKNLMGRPNMSAIHLAPASIIVRCDICSWYGRTPDDNGKLILAKSHDCG